MTNPRHPLPQLPPSPTSPTLQQQLEAGARERELLVRVIVALVRRGEAHHTLLTTAELQACDAHQLGMRPTIDGLEVNVSRERLTLPPGVAQAVQRDKVTKAAQGMQGMQGRQQGMAQAVQSQAGQPNRAQRRQQGRGKG